VTAARAACVWAAAILAAAAVQAASAQTLPLRAGEVPPGGAWFSHAGRDLAADDLPSDRVTRGDASWTVDHGRAVLATGTNRAPIAIAAPPSPVTATHLVFLHTFDPGPALEDWRRAVALAHRCVELPPEAPVVFRYEIEYADGVKLEVPVRFGEGIESWYRVHEVGPMLWAEMAWAKDLDPVSGEKAVLYAMDWPNPRPDAPVKSIGFLPQREAWRDYGSALVLGVSAVRRAAAGAAYYVAPPPVGEDGAPGTFERPWASLARAAAVATTGDTVYVRGGLYVLDRPVVIAGSGTRDRPVTFTAYPGETPVFDAFGIHYDTRVKPYVRDAPAGGPPYQHDTGAIHAPASRGGLRLRGLHVRNSRRAAISVYGAAATNRAAFVDVSFNTVDHAYSMGIIAHSTDDLRIVGNRLCRPHSNRAVFNPRTLEPETASELPQESIDLSRNTRFEIAFNEVYGSGKEAIDCISVQDGRIHHNYVHSSLNGIYIDSWGIPIERLEIDHNFIHNAFNGIPMSTEGSNRLLDFRVHHNLVIDSKSGGIVVSEATYKSRPTHVQRIAVYHNTVDRGGYHATGIGWLSSGINVSGHPGNVDFRDIFVFNNALTREAQAPMSCGYTNLAERHIVFTHNLLWPDGDRTLRALRERDTKGYEQWVRVMGDAPVAADPLYANPERGDYRLRAGSPAIGAGVGVKEGRPDPAGRPADIGALPSGAAWIPGLDWAGHVTAFYRGPRAYEPVEIPRSKCTIHRNHLQRPSWFQTGRYGADLQQLPSGEQCFAGIDWYIEPDADTSRPTVLALKGMNSESPESAITGIPVGRRCDTLAFLHTYHIGPALARLAREKKDAGTILFRYVVHYADGGTAEIPVTWKQQIERWQDRALADLPGARLAWQLRVGTKWGETRARLFAFEWTNPRPQAEIATLDVVSANTETEDYGAPAVLAISAGRVFP
jgi:hypothetical protein